MANHEHVIILKTGVAEWNNWRAENPDARPDLSWANLTGVDLAGANLEGANMKLAFCKGCTMDGAILRGANLYGTNLEGARLTGAVMAGANFEGAHLIGADLSGADLSGGAFKLANLREGVFENADLKGCSRLTAAQLEEAATLRGAKLDPLLLEQIAVSSPALLD